MADALILAINPGSTSTKFAVYSGETAVLETGLRHGAEELAPFARIADQFDFRKTLVMSALEASGLPLADIRMVVGRGGLIRPVPSGVYAVDEAMLADLRAGLLGEHASNLGGLIADDLARSLPEARACIADPVVVDELDPVARLSGHPLFERRSVFHALNQKAVARLHAQKLGKVYEELKLIVAHLGGGISVGAHMHGRVIDVNQALDGDGPYSPERSGSLPVGALAALCFAGTHSPAEVKKMITGGGGYVAYLGTNDAGEVERRAAAGEAQARLVRDGLIYQVAKEIGAMSTVLAGGLDGIILTGGIAFNKKFVKDLTARVRHLGRIFVYPGEDELRALASNGRLVLEGKIELREYRNML